MLFLSHQWSESHHQIEFMLKRLSLTVIAIVSLTVGTTAVSSELIVAVDESQWKPMSWLEDGEVHGFEAEVVYAVLTSMGHQVIWRPVPWARLIAEIRNGSVDAAIGLTHVPERDTFISYSEEPTYQIIPIIVSATEESLEEALEPDNPSPIITTRGYTYGQPLDGMIQPQRIDVQHQHQILPMLKKKRAQFGLLNVSLVNGQLMWDGLSDFFYIYGPVESRPIYVGFSIPAGREGLVKPFSLALRKLKGSPLMEKLTRKYFR